MMVEGEMCSREEIKIIDCDEINIDDISVYPVKIMVKPSYGGAGVILEFSHRNKLDRYLNQRIYLSKKLNEKNKSLGAAVIWE